MRGLEALLGRHEEAALRKIRFGLIDALKPEHVRRLLQLELVEWHCGSWHLTTLGRQRYETLVVDWPDSQVSNWHRLFRLLAVTR